MDDNDDESTYNSSISQAEQIVNPRFEYKHILPEPPKLANSACSVDSAPADYGFWDLVHFAYFG
jgi:hypothetical protein